MRIQSEQFRQLLTVVDQLYGAACDPEKWPVFLASAARLFDSQGTQIGHHDLTNHSLSFSRLFGYEWDEAHYQKYDELMPQDPRLPYFAQNPFKPIHCRMNLSDGELHETAVYKEVLDPGGVEYSIGVNLTEEARSMSYFLALRNKSQNRFGSSECDLLQELIPHLNRAILLQRDVNTIDFERNIAADTLDGMAVGLCVVDQNGVLKFSNRTAQELQRDNDGLSRINERLVASGQSGSALKTAIRSVISQARTGTSGYGIPLQIDRPSGREPLAVLVASLFGDHLKSGWAGLRDPLAILIIRDPRQPVESRHELLSRMYSLTPSQARLANLLVNGLSLRDAAQQAGLTEASARQYLKLIFGKMGVTRQSEMVLKALNMPLPIGFSGS
ncbi:helix-turn-helix transcriptional regulator [Parasedimentitalea maritima]|uniref:HTH luxR-type domain-containing protein n=1 Tax=Parasedimentitalea maritima TaxID=2578117 RepID=A0A6A4RL42_9RHOB|nr:helix-turn-helix transcriptional regulator [Zongyanglinia marina]KAE9632418.1 hypothetical protein GP644_01175 [Zongyanglinia marina]